MATVQAQLYKLYKLAKLDFQLCHSNLQLKSHLAGFTANGPVGVVLTTQNVVSKGCRV